MNFIAMLKELKISKARFAELSGLSIHTIYSWKDNAPKWALEWLSLMLKVRALADECR
jgi:hypothetical protein